jgi:hypothetical protein
MVSYGECRPDLGHTSEFDLEIGVFRGETFEFDVRYEGLLRAGDAFFYDGLPYLASWGDYPSARGSGDPGPPKRHRDYVFVWDTFWLRPGFGASHEGGTAGRKGPICQIGYERLSPTKAGGSK